MVVNVKNFIRNIMNEELQNYMNEDKPIDYDVTSIRSSMNEVYTGGNQFTNREKCDAPEAYEAIVRQIFRSLEECKDEMAEEFEDLVDVKFEVNSSYIYADELLSPIIVDKEDALQELENIKFDLTK